MAGDERAAYEGLERVGLLDAVGDSEGGEIFGESIGHGGRRSIVQMDAGFSGDFVTKR